MRLVSLRARHPGSPAVTLHPRLTVVIGATLDDRDAMRSTFRALVGDGLPALEAIAEIEGVSVPVDATFAATFATRRAPDPVIAVPARTPAPVAVPDAVTAGQGVEPGTSARLTTLRAEQRAVSGELTLVTRALRAERGSSDVMQPAEIDRRQRRVEELVATSDRQAVAPTPVREEVLQLATALREALDRDHGNDSHAMARQLEDLAERRTTARARERALESLVNECRNAVDAAQHMLESDHAPDFDATRLAAVEAVREEMLELASRPGVPSRRRRRRLEELRAAEARLLAELGQATYASLLGSLAGSDSGSGLDAAARAQTQARISLLEELDEFWAVQQDLQEYDRREEARLMGEVALVLGESADAGPGRSPKLVAARLRSAPPVRLGADDSEAARLASRLEAALGLDPGVQRNAADILSVAETTLRAPTGRASTGLPTGGTAETVLREAERLVADGLARSERVRELERTEHELAARLQSVEDRLRSLERASSVPGGTVETAAAGSGAGAVTDLDVDLRSDGVTGRYPGAAPAGWTLADELNRRRSVSVVGALPVLLEEPPSGGEGNVLDGVDPLSLVAMSASNQIVWVTGREEVAVAIERIGDMAAVIRV